MKRCCLAVFLLTATLPGLLFAFQGSANAEPGAPTGTDSSRFLLHLDIDRLAETETGRILVQSLHEIPFVKNQLANIPDELRFLTDIRISSLTVSTGFPGAPDSPLMHIRANIDQEKLFELIGHGRGYAQVGYRGVRIHHWLADLKTLGNQLMGDSEAETDEPRFENVFLANPAPYEYLICTSLANLNTAVDRVLEDEPVIDLSRFTNRQRSLICLDVVDDGNGFPGELRCQVSEDPTGRVVIESRIRCQNAAQRVAAGMINGALNDSDQAKTLLSQFLGNQPETPDSQDAENDQTVRIDGEVDQSGDNNSLSFGMKFDSRGLESGDGVATLVEFLETCLTSTLDEDVLCISAKFYLGPCDVENVPRHSDLARQRGQKLNSLKFVFNAFSTTEQRDTALRVADSQAGWFFDPGNYRSTLKR